MRALLQIALPILLPFAVYLGYVYVMRRTGAKGPVKLPWPWLLGSGVALAALVVGALTLLGGAEPGALYIPPHAVDGQIIPGHFE